MLFKENASAASLFNYCSTQWRYSTQGIAIGFDYPGIQIVMKSRKFKNKKDLFGQLQILEREVLTILEENRNEE